MKRTPLFVLVAAIAAGGLSSVASADPDGNHSASGVTSPNILALIGDDDVFSTIDLTTVLDPPAPTVATANNSNGHGTQHYGPYPSTSPDSGTCGNDWANDAFNRDFTIRANGDGTFTVVQQFKQGSFVTMAGPSPGSCDTTDGSPPGTVEAGKTGSMHGYFIISNVGMQTSQSPYCDAAGSTNANCTTTTFINTHFAPCYPATCQVTTFFFHYAAGDQSLVEHEWKNASADRGGNHGDIRSMNAP